PGMLAVFAVPPFALPRLDRIVLDPIQPAADQGVADLDLMIEEREWEARVQSGDPERDACQLHGQRVDVDAIDAPFDDVSPQPSFDPRLEVVTVVRIVRRKLHDLLSDPPCARKAKR